jgi:dynein heavy chain
MLDQENDDELKAFYLVVFIRCFRMDRNNVCCKQLVHACLNKKSNFYTDPLKISIEDTYKETDPYTPVLFLLSKGADPTAQVEGLCAMYKKPTPIIISMGEGQEVKAEDAIGIGKMDGRWVMLNNSHLSLD